MHASPLSAAQMMSRASWMSQKKIHSIIEEE